MEADEILLAGTIFGVAGVCSLDGNKMQWPGPVYQKLIELWENDVGVNLSQWFQQAW